MPDDRIRVGSTEVPSSLVELSKVLHRFVGPDLENQLQSFNVFLAILAPSVWPKVAELLTAAAGTAVNPEARTRLEAAAREVTAHRFPAQAYDHQQAMRQFTEEHHATFAKTQPAATPPPTPPLPQERPEPSPRGPQRQVDHRQFQSVIARCHATEDPTLNNKGGIGEVERWLDPEGRIVARVVVRYWRGENEVDYYACE